MNVGFMKSLFNGVERKLSLSDYIVKVIQSL